MARYESEPPAPGDAADIVGRYKKSRARVVDYYELVEPLDVTEAIGPWLLPRVSEPYSLALAEELRQRLGLVEADKAGVAFSQHSRERDVYWYGANYYEKGRVPGERFYCGKPLPPSSTQCFGCIVQLTFEAMGLHVSGLAEAVEAHFAAEARAKLDARIARDETAISNFLGWLGKGEG